MGSGRFLFVGFLKKFISFLLLLIYIYIYIYIYTFSFFF